MIREHTIHHNAGQILLGIALDDAVLDILTDKHRLQQCLRLLQEPHQGLVDTVIGTFGTFLVSLNVHFDESISIIVDGPVFDPPRAQCAGIYVKKDDITRVIRQALTDERASPECQ